MAATQTAGAVDLQRELDLGQLVPVATVAESVLGHVVSRQTALRWAMVGRSGVRLPCRRGRNRQLVTTEQAFRRWLDATSDLPASCPAPQRDKGADAILQGFGLPRASKRGGGHA